MNNDKKSNMIELLNKGRDTAAEAIKIMISHDFSPDAIDKGQELFFHFSDTIKFFEQRS